MLNKKGFTIAEVIVSFSLVSVILISMVSSLIFYRDKVKEEETASQLLDFKNTIKIAVYDDIINKGIKKVDSCYGTMNCIIFTDKNDESHVLKIVEDSGENKVFLSYDDIKYFLPDSDLGVGADRVCDFIGGFNIEAYDNKLYKVKTTFHHRTLNKTYDLLFIVG